MKKKWNYINVSVVVIFLAFMVVKANSKADVSNNTLSGIHIVVDSGHGGKDNGAMANDLKEDDINLSIAKKLRKELISKGATVTMTRTGDYDLASDGAISHKKEDMKKRVEIMNQNKTDLFISIHLNSYPSANVHGLQIFYQKGNDEGALLAKHIVEEMDGIVEHVMHNKEGDYYILNESNKLGLLIECGFISNPHERSLLKTHNYQENLVRAMRKGIEDYFYMLHI